MVHVLLAALLHAGLSSSPNVLKLKRPSGGEWLGIFLLGQKAGYEFSSFETHGNPGSRVVVTIEDTTLRAKVGDRSVSRRVREVKTYAARAHGPLLSMEAVHEGDGGDMTISVRFDEKGGHVVRTPKEGAPEQLELPPTKDTLESADLLRLAAAGHRTISAYVFDSTTMRDKHDEAQDLGPDVLTAGGTKASVERVSLTEDDGKIAATAAISLGDGRMLETRFGGALLGVPEPEAVAKRLDTIDLFALTRVAIDRPLPTGVTPETIVYHVTGLPESLRPPSDRQSYRTLADGSVELTVRATPPTQRASRPMSAPADELRATPAIESDAPAIVKAAKEATGDQADALEAARGISHWVFTHLHKAYGVSSDRATDVLRRGEGDCTEHSLLLAAMARAAGIPARLVYGLVYAQGTDGTPGLFWHEWVEVFAGEWVALDPTFDQRLADATHLQLGSGDQPDAVALMGQLKINVVSMNPDFPGTGRQRVEAEGAN